MCSFSHNYDIYTSEKEKQYSFSEISVRHSKKIKLLVWKSEQKSIKC